MSISRIRRTVLAVTVAAVSSSACAQKADFNEVGRQMAIMLQNSHFVDAKVELFAKYGSTQWARVGTYPVTRQLITK